LYRMYKNALSNNILLRDNVYITQKVDSSK
jgi:hypothetical protein